MMNKLNAINENLIATLTSIDSLSSELIKDANAKKDSLLQILADLGESYGLMKQLGKICATAGSTLFNLGEYCDDAAGKVHDTILEFDNIPTGSYGTFVGFCGECGEELHAGDEYEVVAPGEVICAKCAETPDAEVEANVSEEVPANV